MVITLICLLICSFFFCCWIVMDSNYHLRMWRSVHKNNLDLLEEVKMWKYKYYDIPSIYRKGHIDIFEAKGKKHNKLK